MKNFKINIKQIGWVLLLSMIFSTSCKDFLVEDPQNVVAQTNYYSNEQDAIAAVNSIYAWLGSYDFTYGNTAGVYHSTFWVAQGLASDEMNNNQIGASYLDQFATFSFNSENSAVLEMWQMHYKTIFTANIAIARIPGIDMDETLRTRLVNEAKFIRALLYFNLVRMFDKVPLLLEENPPLEPEAASADDIYAQIIKDLTDAENLPASYPAGNGKGRATSGAAKALLAKVYLTMGEYQKCADMTQEVITSEQYALWDNFADVFKISSRNGKEAIFSVSFGDGDGAISFWEVGQFNVRLLPAELSREYSNISNTQGWQVATQNLYDSYSAGDSRKAVTFMTQFANPDGSTTTLDKIYFQKYWDKEADPNAGGSFNDFPVLRYADVLLMNAEANAQLGNFGDANTNLNKVRNRANLTSVDITNKDDFEQEIISERRKEFACEGQRWFDLVRTNTLAEKVQAAKGITPGSDYNLFPIPLRERDLNPNLPQNPGF